MYNHSTLSNSNSRICESIIANNPFKNVHTWNQVLSHLTVPNEVFFQHLSTEVRTAILNGSLNRFKQLRQVATDYLRYMPKTLLTTLDAADFQDSLLSLAATHKQYEIAKELLVPGIYDPFHKDENGKTVFDIVVEHNDTKMLEILLSYWGASEKDLQKLSSTPSDDSELHKIYDLLFTPFRRYATTLSSAMHQALQNELFYVDSHRAIFSLTKKIREIMSQENSIENMAKRVNMMITALDILFAYHKGHQSLAAPDERTDVIIYGLLAQNIRFLKRQLKGSYADFPWEALEFFSSQLLPAVSRTSRIWELETRIAQAKKEQQKMLSLGIRILFYNEAQQAIFDRDYEKIIKAIQSNEEELQTLKEAQKKSLELAKLAQKILTNDLKKLRESLKINMHIGYLEQAHAVDTESNDGKRVPDYDTLYDASDFTRDTYSLERIIRYLNEAEHADYNTLAGRATMHRALQIIGEYVKHTATSPHLTTTAKLPLLLQGLHPDALAEIRTIFSHVRAFVDLNELTIKAINKQHYQDMQVDIIKLHGHFVAALQAHRAVAADISEKIKIAAHYNVHDYTPGTVALPVTADAFPSFEGFRQLLNTWVLSDQERNDLLSTLPPLIAGPTAISLTAAQTRLEEFFNNGRPRDVNNLHYLDETAFNQLVNRLELNNKQKAFIIKQFSDTYCDLPNVISEIKSSKDSLSILEKLLSGDNHSVSPETIKQICISYGLLKDATEKWIVLFNRLKKKDDETRLSLEKVIKKIKQLGGFLSHAVPAFIDLLDCIKNKKGQDHPDFIKANLSFMAIFEKNSSLRSAIEFMMLEIMEGLVGERGVIDGQFRDLLNFSQNDRNYFAHGDALRDSLRFDPITHCANLLLGLFTHDYYLIFVNRIIRALNVAANNTSKNTLKALLVQQPYDFKKIIDTLNKLIPTTGDLLLSQSIIKICQPDYIDLLKKMLSQHDNSTLLKTLSGYIPPEIDWESYDIEFSWQTLEDQTAMGNFEYLLQQRDIAEIANTIFNYHHHDLLVDFEVIGSNAQLRNVIANHRARITTQPDQALTMVINLGNAHWVAMVIRHNALDPQHPTILYRDSFGANVPQHIQNTVQQLYPQVNIHSIMGIQQENSYDCGVFALENAALLTEHTNDVVAGQHAVSFSTILTPDQLIAKRLLWAHSLEQQPNINANLAVGMFPPSTGNIGSRNTLNFSTTK